MFILTLIIFPTHAVGQWSASKTRSLTAAERDCSLIPSDCDLRNTTNRGKTCREGAQKSIYKYHSSFLIPELYI